MSALPRAICHECGRSIPVRNGELREHKPLEGYEATCHDTGPCSGSGTVPLDLLEIIAGHPVHPAAAAWPLMPEAEIAELAADIKANGLREPVRMRGALVLDGRNRLLACEIAGIGPRFERAWAGDAWAFVVSANLHRRHLTTSQRAMVAARMATRKPGGQWTGKIAGSPTQAEAAARLQVSERTVRTAREVLESGDAELAAQVDRGEVAVSAAAEQVRRPDLEALVEQRVAAGVPPWLARLTTGAQIRLRDEDDEWDAKVLGGGAKTIHVGWTTEVEGMPMEAVLNRRTGEEISPVPGFLPVCIVDTDEPFVVPQYTDADGDLSSPRRETGREARERRARGELAPGWPAVPENLDEQRQVAEQLAPEVVRQLERERREARKAEQAANKAERVREQAEQAAAAAGHLDGIDLRCCCAEYLALDLEGAGVRLVHADPPWTYSNHGNGSAESHYKTMTIEDILDDLDRAYDACAADAVLVLWATWPTLGELCAEIDQRAAWRWDHPVSGGAWVKTGRLGVGHWWRGQSEPVLLFVRGRPAVLETIGNSYVSERTQHSEKPQAWLEDLVRAWCPEGGLVLDLYAGLAPMARACRATGRRYVGAEIDETRHAEGLIALTETA